MRVTDIIKKLSNQYVLEKIPSPKVNDILVSSNETKHPEENGQDDIVFDDIVSDKLKDIQVSSDNEINLIATNEARSTKDEPISADIVFSDDAASSKLEEDIQVSSDEEYDTVERTVSFGTDLINQGDSPKKNEHTTDDIIPTYFFIREFPYKLSHMDALYEKEYFFVLWRDLNNFLFQILEGKKPEPLVVTKTAGTIINLLVENESELIKTLFIEKRPEDITAHLINVAIVAAKIGRRLNYTDSQMKELVISALLHDVGMLKIPEGIRKKKEGLSKAEFEEIKRHPQYSYEMLKGIDGLHPIVAEVAYREHEREDGLGYPRGLKGDSIHEYAKIIGLSVIYAAMIQPRPQRGRKFPFEIIKEIIEKHKNQFPEYIIKALIDELSVFPIGIYVRLNTGEIGKVIRTSRLAPLRPVIEVIKGSDGKKVKSLKEYDLTKEHILHIEDTFYEIP